MYTNVNVFMSAINEVNDYLMEKKPDVMGLVETKLSEEMTVPKIGGRKYEIWKRNRIGKGRHG